MRWLAIHFPDLPLEVYGRAAAESVPLAIFHHPEGQRILLCNARATALGVQPGLPVGAARALARDLHLLPRKPGAERAALERVAAWCGQFTPLVSLVPPRGLVLEVGRSLQLFQGASALLQRVARGLEGLGYRAGLCLAPTPGGAELLAAQGGGPLIGDAPALRTALGRLPLVALDLEVSRLQALHAMGLRRLSDLLRLPRAGLAERLGIAWVQRLERMLGEAPDLRVPYRPPPRFSARLELPAEVEAAQALLFAGRRLLLELGGFLLAREAGVQRLEWRLRHPQRAASRFTLGLARPERDAERLLELLQERLEHLVLPAPVREIALVARAIEPLGPIPGELFVEGGQGPAEMDVRFLDRLCARLGRSAVRGLGLAADHRPERAWTYCPPGQGSAGRGRADRPLWLSPKPLPLEVRDGRPFREGRLELGAERERIESGWWDGQEVARDYFVAITPRGERLWVYRELGVAGRWFLHGWFG